MYISLYLLYVYWYYFINQIIFFLHSCVLLCCVVVRTKLSTIFQRFQKHYTLLWRKGYYSVPFIPNLKDHKFSHHRSIAFTMAMETDLSLHWIWSILLLAFRKYQPPAMQQAALTQRITSLSIGSSTKCQQITSSIPWKYCWFGSRMLIQHSLFTVVHCILSDGASPPTTCDSWPTQ